MVNSFSKGHSFCCFKSFLNTSQQGSKGYQLEVPERRIRTSLVSIQWAASTPKGLTRLYAILSKVLTGTVVGSFYVNLTQAEVI